MQKLLYITPLILLVFACSPSKNSKSFTPATEKRTSSSTPQFIESITLTPGEENSSSTAGSRATPPIGPGHNIPSKASINIETGTELQFKYAVMLDENVESMNNQVLLEFIDEWFGTRYVYGGSTKKGIDCSAFTCQLENTVFGKTIPRTSREQFDQSQKIPAENLQAGDLVFFNTRGGVSHVGIYVANNKFVHASTSNGVTISDLNDSYYKRRFMGAGRL